MTTGTFSALLCKMNSHIMYRIYRDKAGEEVAPNLATLNEAPQDDEPPFALKSKPLGFSAFASTVDDIPNDEDDGAGGGGLMVRLIHIRLRISLS
jgi:hypothetical protein